ncbi:hypothetical protein Ciccas_001820 [Cichlidogyrus casuarinus]|uniref:Uncharacterized protein n=1 Tax=Cichlidogyrus casuarinus TaxID=1844966 RepID=A0ABD2QIX9_9PLAT
MENSYCFKETYSYDPSLDLSWGSGLSIPPSLQPNELDEILSASNVSCQVYIMIVLHTDQRERCHLSLSITQYWLGVLFEGKFVFKQLRSAELAEARFQLMCCSTPTRDAVRYMQRNPHSAVQLEVQTIAEALMDVTAGAPCGNMRKRKQIKELKSCGTDSEGEVERETDKKKQYIIQTSDFGIYCVLQRMAHELANYREQLRMKN